MASLREEVTVFTKSSFPEVFANQNEKMGLLKALSSRKKSLWVVGVTLTLFLLSQTFNPKQLQFFHIKAETARTIIDQRLSNLATIFSITLVLIGWLITNISTKEAISFELLFKKIYLYPIFYFVVSVAGCLIFGSLLRDEKFMRLGNLVILGSVLLVLALIFITYLFIQLIRVVDPRFFYDMLEDEILSGVYSNAIQIIYTLKSGSMYADYMEKAGLESRNLFGVDLSNHQAIDIIPTTDGNTEFSSDLFSYKKSYKVHDIKIEQLLTTIMSLQMNPPNYYKPLYIGALVNESFSPFFINRSTAIESKVMKKIKWTFQLKEEVKNALPSNTYYDYFNNRFIKDVKDGKQENIQRGLDIFKKIFDLENKIYKEC